MIRQILRGHSATVFFDQFFHNGQAQARTLVLAGHVRLEQARQHLGIDSRAVVPDADFGKRPFTVNDATGADLDHALGLPLKRFLGIANQVVQQLPDADRIRLDLETVLQREFHDWLALLGPVQPEPRAPVD